MERIREEIGRIEGEIGWIVEGDFNARTEESDGFGGWREGLDENVEG